MVDQGGQPLGDAKPDARLITRVVLRQYKSIAACDVQLGQLSFLVGSNGSGKSNFLDALRFVADALRHSLDHALRDRGGIDEVRRRSGGHPTHIGIRLDFRLSERLVGHYAFDLRAKKSAAYSVQEECRVTREGSVSAYYKVKDGEVVRATFGHPPAASPDRLYLVNVSGLDIFRPLYDALAGMGFYNLNPTAIRELQPPDPGDLLSREGRNLASVLATLSNRAPQMKKRIEEYLQRVVPGVSGVDRIAVGPRETLEFRQDIGAGRPWQFFASNMSDGTLRALGILVALFQTSGNGKVGRRLIAIEEPEAALHPAAAGILTDSLQDASAHAQILVTSHSPELLDNDSIPDSAVLAVTSERGETRIGGLDDAGRSALRDHLYTAGELLRMDQLRPEPSETNLQPDQLVLFGPEA